MVVTILIQIALSCGVVLLYTVVGNFLLNCLGFRRSGDQVEHGGEEGEGDLEDKEVLEEEEEEEKEEKEDGQCEGLPGPSPDALHLLRLTNAFCPAKTEPSIFGRDVNREEYYTEDGPSCLPCPLHPTNHRMWQYRRRLWPRCLLGCA